jgi:hypothetical protein
MRRGGAVASMMQHKGRGAGREAWAAATVMQGSGGRLLAWLQETRRVAALPGDAQAGGRATAAGQKVQEQEGGTQEAGAQAARAQRQRRLCRNARRKTRGEKMRD